MMQSEEAMTPDEKLRSFCADPDTLSPKETREMLQDCLNCGTCLTPLASLLLNGKELSPSKTAWVAWALSQCSVIDASQAETLMETSVGFEDYDLDLITLLQKKSR